MYLGLKFVFLKNQRS